jgi:hypothetical protein
LIYSTSYLVIGVLVKCYVWYDATQYMSEKHIKVNRMMVTPMPFTCFYWYVLGENESEYIVAYRSLFNATIDEKPMVLRRGPHRINELKWKGINQTKNLHRVTNDYCLIESKKNKLIVYDLRFGLLSKFTREKINTPLMGFECALRDQKIVNTKMLRMAPWGALDFNYYWSKVLGN